MMRCWHIIFMFCSVWIGGCATLEDAGQWYFQNGKNVKGVEPVTSLLARSEKDRQLREITYGKLQASRLIQCTILRNQIYVASMKGVRDEELSEVVKFMETAYQKDDQEFLSACENVLHTRVGKIFINIQKEYLRDRP